MEHLLPKQLAAHGLPGTTNDQKNEIGISEIALKKTISSYTREAGVRELDRKIAALCRAIALQVRNNIWICLCYFPIVTGSNWQHFP